ncbi:MAG: DUF4410 domain-containing protein [Bryobacteraceae bacterium]|nr:DUF4410 domain-containing protein [Bryobacteraceae bacterium]
MTTFLLSLFNQRARLSRLAVPVLAACALAAPSSAAVPRCVEIEQIQNPIEKDVPPRYMGELRYELLKQLGGDARYERVVLTGDATLPPSCPGFIVRMTLVEFKKGSRAARALVGFGAGKTKVIVSLAAVDKVTGKQLFSREFKGDQGGWGFESVVGGASIKAVEELADNIVKVLRPVSRTFDVAEPASSANARSTTLVQ